MQTEKIEEQASNELSSDVQTKYESSADIYKIEMNFDDTITVLSETLEVFETEVKKNSDLSHKRKNIFKVDNGDEFLCMIKNCKRVFSKKWMLERHLLSH